MRQHYPPTLEPMAGLPRRVDLLSIGDGFAAVAERALLEEFRVSVNLILVGRATDLIAALSNPEAAPWLILSCHGLDGTILLEALAPEIAAGEPFNDFCGPDHVRRYAHLPDRVVFSTGCQTGMPALAEAFLDAGCQAYIAPAEFPEGSTPLVFLTNLIYELWQGRELPKAVELIRARDQELGMFRLFRR